MSGGRILIDDGLFARTAGKYHSVKQQVIELAFKIIIEKAGYNKTETALKTQLS